MLLANPRASRCAYPASLAQLLNIAAAKESREWISHWDCVRKGATPLRKLPAMAARLGLAKIAIKDESVRSPLGSFKALGAPIGLVRLILRLNAKRAFEPVSLLRGCYREFLQDLTVICATDGNHGRALAAAARSIGCRCVIVLHANVSIEREQAIAAYGAQVLRTGADYDESVDQAARLAAQNGWYVVSDTSYEGYEEIPRDVMQGYGVIAAEITEQTASRPDQPGFTHVFLQGGVGGLAAGILSYLWEFHGACRPHAVVVEPEHADGLYQSALHGRPVRASGPVHSVMAGLACGAASPLAWKVLEVGADYFLKIADHAAVEAMRALAAPADGDIPVVAGESGAAGLAGLMAACADPSWRQASGLDGASRVLLINTEGATAPLVYRGLVSETPQSVLRRQARWQP